jgi:hypothetical protein
MYSATRVIFFIYLTLIVALLALHNPFLGYANTEEPSVSGNDQRFDSSIVGCGGEAQVVWEYYYQGGLLMSKLATTEQVDPSVRAMEKLATLRAQDTPTLRRQAETYNAKCVTTHHVFAEGAQKAYFEWQSRGAFVPWLSSGLSITVLAGAATVVALFAFMLFGRRTSDA